MDTELLSLLVDRTNYINTYWNFFIVVTTTIAGIVASGKFNITRSMRFILAAAFTLFAVTNLHAIMGVNEQRMAISELISSELSIAVEPLRPNEPWTYLTLHILLDLLVLAWIWWGNSTPNSN